MLKENLEKVEENIQAACDRAGRKRDEVTLIAVSKTKPVYNSSRNCTDTCIYECWNSCSY